VRRVVLTFADEAPAAEGIDGVLAEERSKRQLVLTVESWSDETRAALEALEPSSLRVEDCSLEDIFVAYVRMAPEAAGVG